MAKRRNNRPRAATAEPLVNGFAAQHAVYREQLMPDPSGENLREHQKLVKVVRVMYPNTVDKWLAEGGPGFDEPQGRAIDHCRKLWASAGSCGRLVASYGESSHGTGGRERGTEQIEALAQISQYEARIPRVYWSTFEMLCRDDYGAGVAGSIFADNTPQRIAHAKASVGMVASLIAMWMGF